MDGKLPTLTSRPPGPDSDLWLRSRLTSPDPSQGQAVLSSYSLQPARADCNPLSCE